MGDEDKQTCDTCPTVPLATHLLALREADKEHVKELRAADQRALEIKAEGDKEARRIKEQGDEKALNLAREIDSYKDQQQKSDLAAVLSEIKTAIKPLADYVAAQQGRSGGLDAGWKYLLGALGAVATLITLYLALRR